MYIKSDIAQAIKMNHHHDTQVVCNTMLPNYTSMCRGGLKKVMYMGKQKYCVKCCKNLHLDKIDIIRLIMLYSFQ